MAQHDMRHLDFISTVAQEDVAYVDAKDRSYGGSWKRSGGRSAWFMIRRKIDRLMEFLDKPQPPQGFSLDNIDDTIAALASKSPIPGTPDATATILRYLRESYVAEDIFKKIEEEPHGFDGSVLAEVRDLRRYLMLVEAEMMARGVIQPKEPDQPRATVEYGVTVDRLSEEPTGPGTPEDGGHHAAEPEPEPEPALQETPPPPPEPPLVPRTTGPALPSSGVPSFLGSMGTRLTRNPRKATLASVPAPDPEPETPPVENAEVALVDQPFQPVESLRAEVRQWHREKSQRKVVEVKLQDGQVETATYDRATKQFTFDSGKDDATVVEGWRPVVCRTCHKYSTEPCPFVGNDNAMGCEQYRTNVAEWPTYNEGVR